MYDKIVSRKKSDPYAKQKRYYWRNKKIINARKGARAKYLIALGKQAEKMGIVNLSMQGYKLKMLETEQGEEIE